MIIQPILLLAIYMCSWLAYSYHLTITIIANYALEKGSESFYALREVHFFTALTTKQGREHEGGYSFGSSDQEQAGLQEEYLLTDLLTKKAW